MLTGEWRLGRGLCKLWLVVDYLVCTASVFNIVLISFDRFISVTKAVRAGQAVPSCRELGGGAGSPQHRAWSSCRDWGGLQGLHGCPVKQEGGLGSASSRPAEPQPPQERGAVQTQPTACGREHLGQDGQVLLPFTRVRIPPLTVFKIVLYAAGEARRAEGALFTYFILSPTLVKVKKAVPS